MYSNCNIECEWINASVSASVGVRGSSVSTSILHLEVCKVGDHLFGGLVVAHAVMLLVLRVAWVERLRFECACRQAIDDYDGSDVFGLTKKIEFVSYTIVPFHFHSPITIAPQGSSLFIHTAIHTVIRIFMHASIHAYINASLRVSMSMWRYRRTR